MQSHSIVSAECTYGVVEVKSFLSKSELLDACEKIAVAKSLKKTAFLGSLQRQYVVNAYGTSFDYQPTIGIVFAFDGPKIETTCKNFWSWCKGREPARVPDAIWVLGKGFLVWHAPSSGGVDPCPSPGSRPDPGRSA